LTDPGPVKIALVGCGNIAQTHWHGIQNHAPYVEVTAVVDTNQDAARKMAEQTGASAFTELDTALTSGEFDAVDLMLPHDLHVEASLASFNAGKHVLLEKPMAPDLKGCQQILDAAKQAGTVFMIAEQAQYWPDVYKTLELIKNGDIGKIISAQGYFFDMLRVNPDDPIPWRFKLAKSGGGICIDGGAHWIRPLRIWLGEIDEVIASTQHPVDHMEGESLAHALFRFQNGVTATFSAILSDARSGPNVAFRLTGKQGEILIEHGRNGRLLLFNDQYPKGEVIMKTAAGKGASYGLEIHDFSQAILKGTPLQATPEFSLGELRTALAMYRSVETRTWEKVWQEEI